jgi:hypothetical protein
VTLVVWTNTGSSMMDEVGTTARRSAALALIVALSATLLLTAAPAAHATGPCDFGRAEGQSVRAYMRDVIRCAVGRWSVRGGVSTALCIAKRESGLLPWAESSNGINKGLYQQHVDYWSTNYETYAWPGWELKKRILNGRTNAIVSIRMAHAGGWGPWGGSDCG